jgi:heat shock protein HslJ
MIRPPSRAALLALVLAAGPPTAALAAPASSLPPGERSSTETPPAQLPAPQSPAETATQPETGAGAAAGTRSPGQAETAAPVPGFEGSSWRLVAYRSGAILAELPAGSAPAHILFESGRVGGSAGCNRLAGTYRLDGERLAFEPNMAATMMACPEPLMTQEQAVGAAFAQVVAYRLDGRLLELLNAAGQPVLRFLPLEPLPLAGRQWQLRGFNNGKQAVVSVLAGTEITLELRDDGTLGGSDGCNRYMSGYTLEGGTLVIGPLAATRMACRGPEGAAEQARLYGQALARAVGYRIEGEELTLLDADGKTAAHFRAAPRPETDTAAEGAVTESIVGPQ